MNKNIFTATRSSTYKRFLERETGKYRETEREIYRARMACAVRALPLTNKLSLVRRVKYFDGRPLRNNGAVELGIEIYTVVVDVSWAYVFFCWLSRFSSLRKIVHFKY